MVKACNAPGCRYQFMKGDGVIMHSFPNNDALRSKWIQVMKKENCPNYPPKRAVICSQHFQKNCYEKRNGKNVLLRNALPSIFYESKSIRPVVILEIHSSVKNIKESESEEEVEEVDPLEADLLQIFGEEDSTLTPKIKIPTNASQGITDNGENENEIEIENEEESSDPHHEETMTYEKELVDDHDYGCTKRLVEIESDGNEGEVEYYYEVESDEAINEPDVKKTRKQPHFIGDFIYEDLKDQVQRKKYWLMTHQVYEHQRKKLKYFSSRMKLMEKKIEVLTKKLAEKKDNRGERGDRRPTRKIIYAPQKRIPT